MSLYCNIFVISLKTVVYLLLVKVVIKDQVMNNYDPHNKLMVHRFNLILQYKLMVLYIGLTKILQDKLMVHRFNLILQYKLMVLYICLT
jgi:hypothetical protein